MWNLILSIITDAAERKKGAVTSGSTFSFSVIVIVVSIIRAADMVLVIMCNDQDIHLSHSQKT